MRCAECGCFSLRAPGWIAVLGLDPDDDEAPAEVVAFCPVCAFHEFLIAEKAASDYF